MTNMQKIIFSQPIAACGGHTHDGIEIVIIPINARTSMLKITRRSVTEKGFEFSEELLAEEICNECWNQ